MHHTTLVRMVRFVLVSVVIALAGCGRSHLFYDARELRHAPIQPGQKRDLEITVADKLKGRALTWVDEDGKERALKTDAASLAVLGVPELGALWLATATGDNGGENDVRVRVGKTSSVAVSVLTALDGSVRLVSAPRGGVPAESAAPSEDEIKQRFDLEAKLPGKWHETELRALADSLALLAPEELAVVKHVQFDRQAQPKDGDLSHAALYEDGGCSGVVYLYSSGVRADTFRFVGDPSAPKSAVLHSLVHEIGHAFEQAAARDRFCAARKAKGDRANDLVNDGEKMREESPVIVEYQKALGSDPAPTDYGNTSKHESFAESFALFHVDPDALKRTNPSVFAWFAAHGHIKALAAAHL
ncbi:MAG TPA: hypothetical protein VGO62_04895 [Myxococcota bacterium]